MKTMLSSRREAQSHSVRPLSVLSKPSSLSTPFQTSFFFASREQICVKLTPKTTPFWRQVGGKISSFLLFALPWSFLLSCPSHLVLILPGYLKVAPKMYDYHSNVLQMGGLPLSLSLSPRTISAPMYVFSTGTC